MRPESMMSDARFPGEDLARCYWMQSLGRWLERRELIDCRTDGASKKSDCYARNELLDPGKGRSTHWWAHAKQLSSIYSAQRPLLELRQAFASKCSVEVERAMSEVLRRSVRCCVSIALM